MATFFLLFFFMQRLLRSTLTRVTKLGQPPKGGVVQNRPFNFGYQLSLSKSGSRATGAPAPLVLPALKKIFFLERKNGGKWLFSKRCLPTTWRTSPPDKRTLRNTMSNAMSLATPHLTAAAGGRVRSGRSARVVVACHSGRASSTIQSINYSKTFCRSGNNGGALSLTAPGASLYRRGCPSSSPFSSGYSSRSSSGAIATSGGEVPEPAASAEGIAEGESATAAESESTNEATDSKKEKASHIPSDIIAGISTACVAIPQSCGYALLAGTGVVRGCAS